MKHLAIGCTLALGLTITAFSSAPADARGGVNASYARAYCYYYKTMVATVARNQSKKALSSQTDSQDAVDRRSSEYWRQAYRDCLRENGY